MQQARTNRLIKQSISGFTLLELSIVIIIVGAIVGAGFVMGKSMMESSQLIATNNRLNQLDTALLAYRQANNRLPCPAYHGAQPGDVNYGTEMGAPGNCGGGVYGTYVNGGLVVDGLVPTKALGLPDDFMRDGWGRHITYGVYDPATAYGALLDFGVQSNCGTIPVRTATAPAGTPRTTTGMYVLVSHGANGHGAYNGIATHIRSGSTNTDELTNCHCNSAGASIAYNGTYIQKEATENVGSSTDNFDDIVRFKERWQLQSIEDGLNPGGNVICPHLKPGFIYEGNSGEALGYFSNRPTVATGDINGDGIRDIIMGDSSYDAQRGRVTVLFGQRETYTPPIIQSTALNGTNGFYITSSVLNDDLGFTVKAGDVNDDGIDDVVMGSTSGAYVMFGGRGVWPASVPVSGLNGSAGTGGALGTFGFKATAPVFNNANVGDINGDGVKDLLIADLTAPTGKVYVIYGGAGPVGSSAWNATFAADSVNGVTGFPITLKENYAVELASGDINYDGYSDVIIGGSNDSPNATAFAGSLYVVFGKPNGWNASGFNLASINGSNGFQIDGTAANGFFAKTLALGDFNRDGVVDLVMGAPGNNKTYVLYGHSAAWISIMKDTVFNGKNGLTITNATTGYAVAAGDVNADGYSDIITAAFGPPDATFVIFGSASLASSFDVSTLNGNNGFVLNGIPQDLLIGGQLATGDVNADGRTDLIIGAQGHTNTVSGVVAGGYYIYYGQRRTGGGWTSPYGLTNIWN